MREERETDRERKRDRVGERKRAKDGQEWGERERNIETVTGVGGKTVKERERQRDRERERDIRCFAKSEALP